MRKEVIVLGILFMALTIPLVSSFFHKGIKESPQDVSVTVGNVAPTVSILYVDVGQDDSVTLLAAATVAVEISFTAFDPNGATTIVDASVTISYDLDAGGEQRNIFSCPPPVTSGPNTKTFVCTVDMEHYDASGFWTATVGIDDLAAANGQNTRSFIVEVLSAISLLPLTPVLFGTVSPGAIDVPSIVDTTVTNEGNFNIGLGGLTIASENLVGQTSPVENIPGGNFRSADGSAIDPCNIAEGAALVVSTPVSIPLFILSKGTTITPLPTRNIKHCLKTVPGGLSSQEYATTGFTPWDLAI